MNFKGHTTTTEPSESSAMFSHARLEHVLGQAFKLETLRKTAGLDVARKALKGCAHRQHHSPNETHCLYRSITCRAT